MQNPIEIAKAHPYLTAGGVAVLGIVLVLILSSGSETEQVQSDNGGFNPYASENAAANSALAQAQLGAQVATVQLNNELAATKDSNATAAIVAKENFAYLQNKDVLASKVSVRALEAEEYGIRRSTEVSMLQINKAAEIEAGKTSAAYHLGLAGYNSANHIANLAAGVENNRIGTEAATAANLARIAQETRYTELHYDQTKSWQTLQLENTKDQRATDTARAKDTNDFTLATFQQASNNILRLSKK